jgi:DNA-binding CsgD family transcriptional regulator
VAAYAKSGLKPHKVQGREHPWVAAEPGLILLDPSLKALAFNPEAEAILAYPDRRGSGEATNLRIPEEVLEKIGELGSSGCASLLTYFQAGRREYVAWACSLESHSGLPERLVALMLLRNSSTMELVTRVSAQYKLTDRERETLEAISQGLSSKEAAERMHISPNTVRTYLRLIMMKMSVGTRAGVLAKILAHNLSLNQYTDSVERLQLCLVQPPTSLVSTANQKVNRLPSVGPLPPTGSRVNNHLVKTGF